MGANNTYLHSITAFLEVIQEAIRPDKKTNISQWAEDNRILPEDTPEPGPWRNRRTPYLVDIMDTMSPTSSYTEGWCMKGHQLGGSSVGENFIGHAICEAAGSMLIIFPTIEDGNKWELSRFEPMRKNTPALRQRIKSSLLKGADNTKRRKKYPGGFMQIVSANRAGAVKSSTIRYVKYEEPDEYPLDVDGQGNPIDLARKRTSNFGRKARLLGDGTPTVDGASQIQRQFKRGDQRRWFVPCPDCGEFQYFEWSQMKWQDDNHETAQYACKHCGVLNNESAWKGREYHKAHWRPTAKGEPGVASWHLPALVAPIGWRPWTQCVAEWIAAQGDEEALKVFYNNTLAECFKDTVHAETTAEALAERAEHYPLMQLPNGALLAVAGVDVQDNRLAIGITAYGRNEESWRIFYGEIYGSPASQDVWDKLRELLNAPIRHASGQILKGVDAAAIDTGGHHTEEVYAFTRDAKLKGKHWFAIKGASAYDAVKLGKPKQVEFNYKGRAIAGGAELRMVGTQSIKTLLANRLYEVKQPGPGYWHFSTGLTIDYYQMLIAERRQWVKDKRTGRKVLMWIRGSGLRNESWDTEVYGYAALLYATSGRHVETVFRERERLFGEKQSDLFVSPSEPASNDLAAIAANLNSQELTDQAETAVQPIDESKVLPSIFTRRSRRGMRSRGIGS